MLENFSKINKQGKGDDFWVFESTSTNPLHTLLR